MSVDAAPRTIREEAVAGAVPIWSHPEWSERFPWLIQGTTGAGPEGDPFDLGLAGAQPVGTVLNRWDRLREALGAESAIHSLQVHGADLHCHVKPPPPGLSIMRGVDGHLTELPKLLLTVSIADCVPVSLVAEGPGAIELLHAGWRGTAAGILENGVRQLSERYDSDPRELWMHCGPAICGDCYEVGPEVHAALTSDGSSPPGAEPIDLRAVLAGRAIRLGIEASRITISAHCTLCGGDEFFSHRGGSPGRQMGLLARRR